MPPPAQSSPDQVWTTKRLLDWLAGALAEKSIDSPRLCAEMLLTHVLRCNRMHLYTQADRPASSDEREALRDLAARALKHEPVQYLVGEAWFFALEFQADRRALIPRPATETIVETILQHARNNPVTEPLRVADVCTGSGCIAIALAKNLAGAHFTATDISPDALALAQENAHRHAVADRIEFLQGDLLAPIPADAAPFHYIASNPPYIPDHEWGAVEPNVRDYEPTIALRAGADGLRFVNPLIDRAPDLLAPGGTLLIEIAACTEQQALSRAAASPRLRAPRILKDLEGLPRVLVAHRA